MSNPIRVFENLKEMYLRYLDSPFDLRYDDLIAERRNLLDEDGRIYRRPLIEPVPAYRSSQRSFAQAAPALLSTWQPADVAAVIDFISLGLFLPALMLHQHQQRFPGSGHDLARPCNNGDRFATESFMLPVVASSFVGLRLTRWSRLPQWIGESGIYHDSGQLRQWGPRAVARDSAKCCLRSTVPLNALVEDQLAYFAVR
jgi:hypothetical protein